jgi:hypothetical protein
MRKLIFLFSGLLLTVCFISCEKQPVDNQNGPYLKSNNRALYSIAKEASTPVSDAGIIPYIIPGENRGGNRTCDEVAAAFSTTFALCGDKIDYDQGTGEFMGEFPEGLEVEVNGIFVSFFADGCIDINGQAYKVGAVIVKGANAANVYYYPGGSLEDGGLAAPGNKPMVSNLTFCFIPCEEDEPELLIAFKGQVFTGGSAITNGAYQFKLGEVGKLYQGPTEVGIIEVGNFDDEPLLEVRVTINYPSDPAKEFYNEQYLFIGTPEEWALITSYFGYNYYKNLYPVRYLTYLFDLTF